MKPARIAPVAQLFVCTNARASDDPLQSRCGEHGGIVLAALKRKVAQLGRVSDVWVTKTGCLGQCPKDGCSVVIAPSGEQWVDVREGDVTALLERALQRKP